MAILKKKSDKFKHNQKKEKTSYSLEFGKKKFSVNGLFALILGLIALAFLPLLIYYAAMTGDAADYTAGGAGMSSAFLAFFGAILAVGERNVADVDLRLPRAGLWICSLAVFLWLIVLLIGIF